MQNSLFILENFQNRRYFYFFALCFVFIFEFSKTQTLIVRIDIFCLSTINCDSTMTISIGFLLSWNSILFNSIYGIESNHQSRIESRNRGRVQKRDRIEKSRSSTKNEIESKDLNRIEESKLNRKYRRSAISTSSLWSTFWFLILAFKFETCMAEDWEWGEYVDGSDNTAYPTAQPNTVCQTAAQTDSTCYVDCGTANACLGKTFIIATGAKVIVHSREEGYRSGEIDARNAKSLNLWCIGLDACRSTADYTIAVPGDWLNVLPPKNGTYNLLCDGPRSCSFLQTDDTHRVGGSTNITCRRSGPIAGGSGPCPYMRYWASPHHKDMSTFHLQCGVIGFDPYYSCKEALFECSFTECDFTFESLSVEAVSVDTTHAKRTKITLKDESLRRYSLATGQLRLICPVDSECSNSCALLLDITSF